jgi:hypothetical protein
MLKRLSHWARHLKYGQFRLLLTLAELTEDDEHHSVTIAARELCKLAQIALSIFDQKLGARAIWSPPRQSGRRAR